MLSGVNNDVMLQDFSRKCKQNADKSFAPLSYGRTLFIGDSVRQREQLMARAFDICIIVEGKVSNDIHACFLSYVKPLLLI